MTLEEIEKATRVAEYEGTTEVVVDISDLRLLLDTINDLQIRTAALRTLFYETNRKLEECTGKSLEEPHRLGSFIDTRS